MTEAATHFITPVTMQALSGRPVFTSQCDDRVGNNMAHIDLSREADAIVVAPASTDFLAKLAHGMADDLLSTLCIARDCPLLVAPAMNRQMWAAPATQRNAAQLRADDVTLLGPDAGDQACGEVGDGRMLEPEDIVEQLIGFFQPKLLRGHRVLLTAGPTFEPIDPVRGITNLSSGKMGFALARAAAQAGAEKKQNDTDVPALTFTQNPDILAAVAHRANAPFCVGFAAETERLEEFGEAKRQKKGIPLLVGNLGHQTFGRDDNEVALFEAAGITRLPRADKLTLARQIVAAIADRVHGARP
jgi:phosphopantothenoylcysteine decarboxylase/phosphopantothenate--cysteine ligase